MRKRMLSGLLMLALFCTLLMPGALAVDIQAASAIVIDAQTGQELYAKDPDTARVPASMTKVMTAYIVYQELEKGTIQMDTPVRISHNVAVKSRDSNYPTAVPLTEGATYPVETLLHLIMIPSASASCIAMAEHISGSEAAFVERMNATARELGVTATYYNCHGAQPNYVTARSQAKLTRIFIDTYPDILRITSKSGYSFNGRYYNNTNHLLNTMGPYEGLDGFKTGTISAAGYCVTTTAVRDGRRVIAVVLKSTSDAQRFRDSRQLLDYGFAEIARRDAARAATQVTITAAPSSVRPYEEFQVSASLSGLTSNYVASAQWYVNGKAVSGYGNAWFEASPGKVSTLDAAVYDMTSDTVEVSFVLTMPDGTEKRADLSIPLEQRPLTYTGSLNIRSAQVYPGKELTLTADITGENGIASVSLPAQWQWDGQTIQGASNPAFQVTGDRAHSAYTIKIPADAQPGTHEVRFVLGSDALTGVETCVLSAAVEIVVPEPEEPAETVPEQDTEQTESETDTEVSETEPDAGSDAGEDAA